MVIEWEHVQYAMQNPTQTDAVCSVGRGNVGDKS